MYLYHGGAFPSLLGQRRVGRCKAPMVVSPYKYPVLPCLTMSRIVSAAAAAAAVNCLICCVR